MITDHISKDHSDIIIEKLCDAVGKKPEEVDFTKEDWYLLYSWTEAAQDEFRVWLGKFLKKHHYVGRGKKRGMDWGYYEAGKMIMNYGWRTT